MIACIWMATNLRRNGDRPLANLLLVNLAAQVVIGTANVLLLAPTWIQVLHLFGADVFWITLVALAVPVLLKPKIAAVAIR